MTRAEALAIAREVINGRTRSHVAAALELSKFLVHEEEQRALLEKKIEELSAKADDPA